MSSQAGQGAALPAQVRLNPREWDAIRYVMRALGFTSTSEVLREGLRLVTREVEAAEAAQEIRAFYNNQPAPVPEGVAAVTQADLHAADQSEW